MLWLCVGPKQKRKMIQACSTAWLIRKRTRVVDSVLGNIYLGAACSDLKDVFAPKAKAPAGDGDWAGTLKAMLPVVFNVGLVIFLVKAVKAQIRKQKASMEKDLKDKLSKKGD
eukprot:TRINITY_DN11853_c0_g1_i3.p1 TRINITY_DN11853_c0_g1~~TRINITY_DN11853_c0_g1_i3.p1  ORF type:complete len:113 (-),score=18.16 TRINITY_DN11853_c0_g1_i3:374-712(-)